MSVLGIQARLSFTLAIVSSGIVGIWGQAVPVFHARRNEVEVAVRLMNGHRAPLTDVSDSAFGLRVDGIACRGLSVDRIESPASAKPSAETSTPGKSRPARAIPIRTATLPRVIYLLDLLNTAPVDRVRLFAALRASAAAAPEGERLGLASLAAAPKFIVPLGSDRQALLGAIGRLRPYAVGEQPRADFAYDPQLVDPTPEGRLARRLLAFHDYLRAKETLAGLQWLARVLAQVPGGKVVIWLTGDPSPLNPSFAYQFRLGEPATEPVTLPRSEYQRTFRLLNAAGATVWPLQIRGVSNPGMIDAASSAHAKEVDALHGLQLDRAGDARLAMFTVAESTGGVVFEGSNDLTGLLTKAASLAAGYYLLTCPFTLVPTVAHGHALRDGKLLLAPGYHAIKVRVARHGVHVLARRSVFITAGP